MIPTTTRPLVLTLAATLAALPALGTASAQAEEVLCPIFIPEAPAKYCIIVTGSGCVVVHVSSAGGSRTIVTCPA